ncbi:MAG: nitroreductase family protein [Rectinemataceae bacterium]|nr:nitroreductase family protein [Rectinemataceae bacterium]
MKDFLSLATSRRSIRKYLDRNIPDEDLRHFIDAAVNAPSGCNSQCWYFVVIKDKAVIQRMAAAVVEKTFEFYGKVIPPDGDKSEFQAFLETKGRAATFFVNAPAVIAVFMTKLTYYDPRITGLFEDMGYSYEAMMERMSWPDVLSIGAAIQNMLLAIHERGYGACWMNEPAIAGDRMNGILGVPGDCRFISLIPVGIPSYVPKAKTCKKFENTFKIVG